MITRFQFARAQQLEPITTPSSRVRPETESRRTVVDEPFLCGVQLKILHSIFFYSPRRRLRDAIPDAQRDVPMEDTSVR